MPTSTGSRKPVRSASTIIAGTESGQHLLKIDGYSHTKDKLPTPGSNVKSRSFRVGGHSWHISYYPSGNDSDKANCISIFLNLDDDVDVKAQFKDVLEKSEYLRDDCLTIVCDLTVFMELQTEDIDVDTATPPPPPPPTVVVPPSDLHRHLGGLLATGEGADVTFEVSGKTFAAHRLVLAARSPVFRAELFGPSKELGATTGGAVDHTAIRIDDMEARDFEALLRYMYTDSLPEPETTKGGGDAAAMLPDLVAAASRYKMERLRLVCEHKLCEYVNGRTVVSMLAFAREHHCDGLKEKCLRFLDDPVKVREIVKAR
nr:BTB/POZ and MATH domain-containing protein 2 [Oryza sativa Japonica Group]